MKRAKRTLQENVVEAVSLANEAETLKAEIARMRPVFNAAMRVLKQHKGICSAKSLREQGKFYEPQAALLEACARAERKTKGK